MPSYKIHFWRKAPFLRFVLSMAMGIVVQWYLQCQVHLWLLTGCIGIIILFLSNRLPLFQRWKFSYINGVTVIFLFASLGGLLAYTKDVRNNKTWFGPHYLEGDAFVALIDESPSEKTNSIKSNATVKFLLRNNSIIPINGRIILYFNKESTVEFGNLIIFRKPLQEIRNSGNPGSFDYKRYTQFQGITHQVFFQKNEYSIINVNKGKWLKTKILQLQNWTIQVLSKYIRSSKELGLAEALLIGYKDDLDKTLVQSYSNTGVVHVIAISGLHLGIIYMLLAIVCRPFKKHKQLKWLAPLIIISGLWLFSLLAGAQPSVLRSAVMFTCIVLGDMAGRRTSIYNTLAFSAFLLLCYNPYWLWDVGFQLSYAAVLSIVIFMRPIYNLLYFKNRAVDFFWKLNAVTLAAQILTTPVSIYHFHQFPNYFILTNFIAVPLSTIILLGEILLCCISFFSFFANQVGILLEKMIKLMNDSVENVESLPYSLSEGLQINFLQLLLLYIIIGGVCLWLIDRWRTGAKVALLATLLFALVRFNSFIESARQQKIIIYNLPHKTAIDFLIGRQALFHGDSTLLTIPVLFNNNFKPCRNLHRVSPANENAGLNIHENFISFGKIHVLLAGDPV